MSEPAVARMTYEEYLEREKRSEVKHEYLDGEVRAMAGGSIEDARLASSFTVLLGAALSGRPCAVFSSDGKVRIEASNRSTYLDLSVVCSHIERSPIDPDAIVNPIVIVEVRSETTEGYDRGEKFRHYRRLASLREYVLVSQAEPLVEVWRRAGDLWDVAKYGTGSSVQLIALDASISVDALYANPLQA